MDNTVILIVNLKQADTHSGVHALLDQHFVLHETADSGLISEMIRTHAPQAICFEYDYPDVTRLAVLQDTKINYPSIPIVVVTEQSSERLAVWAFRARVWDYLSWPVLADEIISCFKRACSLPHMQEKGAARELIRPQCNMPAEVRLSRSNNTTGISSLDPAVNYVERNLDKKIQQPEMAKLCGFTSSHFSRMFKNAYGFTFQEFILTRRMHEAIRLLKNPSASITDVAYMVGFTDHSYFTRTFRRFFNMAPSFYKQSLVAARSSLEIKLQEPD